MESIPRPDWVSARAKCSLAEMFEILRGEARADTQTRNEILNAQSEDQNRFKFKDQPKFGFTVWDSWDQRHRTAVDFELREQQIYIASAGTKHQVSISLDVTLNEGGVCRFRCNGEELESWQVLRRALEGLFFG